jgi:hypothetical protein
MDKAHTAITTNTIRNNAILLSPTPSPLIFHLPFHPRGIQRQTIQEIYQKTLGRHIPDRTLTVAVSRPRNLQERVSSTKLKDVQGKNPSDYIVENGGDH